MGAFDYMDGLGRTFGGAGDSRTRRERLAAALHVIRDTERDLAPACQLPFA
jgi:hypothetical protein